MLTKIFQETHHRQIHSLEQINNHFLHLGNQLKYLRNLTIFSENQQNIRLGWLNHQSQTPMSPLWKKL